MILFNLILHNDRSLLSPGSLVEMFAFDAATWQLMVVILFNNTKNVENITKRRCNRELGPCQTCGLSVILCMNVVNELVIFQLISRIETREWWWLSLVCSGEISRRTRFLEVRVDAVPALWMDLVTEKPRSVWTVPLAEYANDPIDN